jgi:SAM-dependent methyltransferase
MMTADDIAVWSDPGQEPSMSYPDAMQMFHLLGPRARFLQGLPQGATVLDAGAGDGALVGLRDWLMPHRADLKLYGWAGDSTPGLSRFVEHEVGWWPAQPPSFGGRQFDAIMSSNFIEHIDDPLVFVRWAVSRLSPRGSLYLEWPRMESIDLPRTADFEKIGLPIAPGAYHDDRTHRQKPPLLDDVLDVLKGLDVVQRGAASVPWIDQQMAIHARRAGDRTGLVLAYWSLSGWCQYLCARAGG